MATVREIAEWVGASVVGDASVEIARVSGLGDAAADCLVFASDDAAMHVAMASGAGAVIGPMEQGTGNREQGTAGTEQGTGHREQGTAGTERGTGNREQGTAGTEQGTGNREQGTAGKPVLRVKHPKLAFARAAQKLTSMRAPAGVHATAVVHTKDIGEGVSIGPYCVIAPHVKIGANCQILPHVTIYPGVTLGENCVVQSGVVLGATGFGYVRDGATGEYVQFPQQGTLVIEDDVEIGANTTIDRGALGETRIGRGTKIDNQVHIAHNCVIGKNVVIAAQVGMSGSCVVGDGVVMAGQVGLGDHVTIGPGVILGGASGVFPGKRLEGPGQMFMGVPAEPLKDYLKNVAKVRRLK